MTSWHDYPTGIIGWTEARLLSWLQEHAKPGTTWLDVGAHYGYTALALSRLVGKQGRVFSFEPMLATAGHLTESRMLNGLDQLTVIAQALGCPETLEWVTLPTVRGMADRTRTASSGEWRERIQVARFDWLWPHINSGDPRIDGVKIDVQGMEVEVLRGMSAALAQQRPLLVVEVHEGVDQGELVSVVTSCGYDAVPVPIEGAGAAGVTEMMPNTSYAFFPEAAVMGAVAE